MKQLRDEIMNYEEIKNVVMTDDTLEMIASQMHAEMFDEANKIIKIFPEKENEIIKKFEEVVAAMAAAIKEMKGKNLSLEKSTEVIQSVLEGCNIPEYMQ